MSDLNHIQCVRAHGSSRAAVRLAVRGIFTLLLAVSSAWAQSFEVVVDFGNPSGQQPKGGLVAAPDGCLYGTAVAGGANAGTIFSICGGVATTEHLFEGGTQGSYPEAGLTLGSDGVLYGVARMGGASNSGTIFKFNASTGQFLTLHTFSGSNGSEPRSELSEGTDGRLYGVTAGGGASGMGTVFSIEKSGSGFKVLASFNNTNGRIPGGKLVQGPDGFWYGTTASGGAASMGLVFKVGSTGGLSTVVTFTGTNGSAPRAGLILANDGYMYGTTSTGGASSQGTIFRVSASGAFALLRSFGGTNGANPYAELVQAGDGYLYGTTMLGGASSNGVVFKSDLSGNVTVLRALGSKDGGRPESGLVEMGGRMYGTTPTGGPSGSAGTVFEISPAGAFSRIASFSGTPAVPYAPLLAGKDGSLYGVSYRGGTAGSGTIFRLNPGVSFEVLYGFGGTLDGSGPYDGLTQAADGTLYGAADGGGVSNAGVVFRYGESAGFSTLFSFTSTVGIVPYASPVQGTDGHLYGVTSTGGASQGGTLYRLTAAGSMSVIHSFTGTGGKTPFGRLVLGHDGVLYGTTSSGGANYAGTIFSYDPISKTFKTVHTFSGADGAFPYAGLTQGTDGLLYGVTYGGGASGAGTIFSFDRISRQLTTLHSLALKTGAYPYGSLVEAADGRLYGTASYGAGSNLGSVFAIKKTGADFSLLHSFNGADGSSPRAGLVVAPDGHLYGTTPNGGSTNSGVIFRVALSSAPPATAPAAPGSLSAAAISSTRIDLAWTDKSTNESEFRIERCQGSSCSGFVQIATAPADAQSFSSTTLTAGTTYTYRVRASNSAGTSSYSNTAAATTSSSLPAAPGILVATAASQTRIDLIWSDNSTNESEFRIERCQGAGCTNFAQIGIAAAGIPTFSDTMCIAGTTYGYRVRAANSAGASSPSNAAFATTPASVPPPSGDRINVALASNGAVARASSSSTGYLPAYAIDGDRKGLNWPAAWRDGNQNVFADWLEVEFNGTYSIDQINVIGVQDAYTKPIEPTATLTSTKYTLKAFDVQYWTGSSWAVVPGGTITGNNLVLRSVTFAPIATTKIRVLVKSTGDGWSRVIEVEALAGGTTSAPPPPGDRVNVALAGNGAVARASSSSTGYLPAHAIDGDRKGLDWPAAWRDGNQNVFSDWLEVEFNGTYSIDQINVIGVQDAYTTPIEPTATLTSTKYTLKAFDVQYWTGSSWAVVPGGTITGNNLVLRSVTFAPISTTKIRILVKATGDGWSRVVEVGAFTSGTSQ